MSALILDLPDVRQLIECPRYRFCTPWMFINIIIIIIIIITTIVIYLIHLRR